MAVLNKTDFNSYWWFKRPKKQNIEPEPVHPVFLAQFSLPVKPKGRPQGALDSGTISQEKSLDYHQLKKTHSSTNTTMSLLP